VHENGEAAEFAVAIFLAIHDRRCFQNRDHAGVSAIATLLTHIIVLQYKE